MRAQGTLNTIHFKLIGQEYVANHIFENIYEVTRDLKYDFKQLTGCNGMLLLSKNNRVHMLEYVLTHRYSKEYVTGYIIKQES